MDYKGRQAQAIPGDQVDLMGCSSPVVKGLVFLLT